MVAKLIRKLEKFAVLSALEKRALEQAVGSIRLIGPREDFFGKDERPRGVSLMLQGFACRYKLLSDGRRQIVGYFIPGDTCDLRVYILKHIDHSMGTVTACVIGHLPHETIAALAEDYPALTRAMWWSGLIDEAITREWVVNVGQRTGYERTAHLLCEVYFRFEAVGLTTDNSCEFPLTQQELADTVALSPVHVNRILQELRQNGLITLRDRRLTVLDLGALQAAGLFSPNYLQLDIAYEPPPSLRF